MKGPRSLALVLLFVPVRLTVMYSTVQYNVTCYDKVVSIGVDCPFKYILLTNKNPFDAIRS
jgi:hypothetical protein